VNPHQPDISKILAQAYEEFKAKGKLRPMCLCNGEPGLPMYIVKVSENFYLKRMPNTGRDHAVGCGSWEMPDEFSGRTDVFGSGISYDGENMMLRLSFPLAKQGSRVAPEPNPNSSDDKLSVNNGGKRLSLQGLLHMLWEEAGLNKWQGAEPNRTWEYVFQNLNMAVDGKVVKQHPLGRFLYIPQPFNKEKIEELEGDRKKRFIEHAMQEGKQGHQLMLLIAELKKIDEAGSGGYRAIVKHVPGFSFIVNDHLNDRIIKNYSKEIATIRATEEKWSHQIVAATFSVMPEGSAEIEEISYMPVTAQWIPFDNIYENELFSKLVATKRSFTRPLRYNRAKGVSMPSAVLTDTAGGPTALYVVAVGQDIEKVQRESLELDYDKWFWDLTASAMLPGLPPRREATEDASDYEWRVGEIVKPAVSPAPAPTAAHPFLKNETAPVAPGNRLAEQRAPLATSPAKDQTLEPPAAGAVAIKSTPAIQPEPEVKAEESSVALVEPQGNADPLNTTAAKPMVFE
jgi:hypothetical protein